MNLDEIRKKLDEIYHSDEVIIELAHLGDKAIEPLGEYLAGPPEVVPESRVAAVKVLGLIGTKPALEQLKKTLFKHEFKNLDPMLAQSEYVVKNAVIEELLRNSTNEPYCDFLDAFRRYRLPAAIKAIVGFKLLNGIPLLIDALEDDVLVTRAAEGLHQLGKKSVPALLRALSIKNISNEGIESRISRQRRMFAAITLGEIGDETAEPILRQMMEEPDPNLAGIAVSALIKLNDLHLSLKEAKLLLKGALSPEWIIRENCRSAAIHLGELGSKAALELIHLESMPDFYGNPQIVSQLDKSWLVTYIIENTISSHFIDILIKECPKELLRFGISGVESESSISNLLILAQSNKREIKQVVAHVLRRMPEEKAVKTLIHLLGDWDRETVKEAHESLMCFPKKALEQFAKDEILSIKSIWKRLLIQIRLNRVLYKRK